MQEQRTFSPSWQRFYSSRTLQKLLSFLVNNQRSITRIVTSSWSQISAWQECHSGLFHPSCHKNINLLLTEREGRTGEYWLEVVTVRTERSEVRTKTTEGQYFPVRPGQARLVNSLLYGTLLLIVKCTSGGLHLKNVRLLQFRKNFNLFSFCWYFQCEE